MPSWPRKRNVHEAARRGRQLGCSRPFDRKAEGLRHDDEMRGPRFACKATGRCAVHSGRSSDDSDRRSRVGNATYSAVLPSLPSFLPESGLAVSPARRKKAPVKIVRVTRACSLGNELSWSTSRAPTDQWTDIWSPTGLHRQVSPASPGRDDEVRRPRLTSRADRAGRTRHRRTPLSCWQR